MNSCQDFPETVEEFMEEYKMVDTKEVYSNGTEFVPIFRMKQWFEHEKKVPSAEPKTGRWIENETTYSETKRQSMTCSVCGWYSPRPLGRYCRWCGARMEE